MKSILHSISIAISVLLITSSNCFANEIIGNSYALKVDHMLQECDINGNNGTFINKLLPEGAKFKVVNKLANGDYVIKFWQWGNDADENALRATTPATTTANLYSIAGASPTNAQKLESFNFYYDGANWQIRFFKISSGDLELFAEQLMNRISPSIGAATLPFKYRGITGEFAKDVSISGLGGIKLHCRNEIYVSFLLGLGLSDVTLDSTNTDGFLKKSTNVAAYTISTGFVLEWNKAQIGVFTGWDNVAPSDINNWRNQGKPWLGLGIGFSIFSESSPTKEGKNK